MRPISGHARPAPKPRSNRPSESRSIDVAALASMGADRSGRFATLVRNRSLEVLAMRLAMSENVSRYDGT
jgi:hypothetical protein